MWGWILDIVLLLIGLGIAFYPRIRRMMNGVKLLDNREFNQKIADGGQLIDIRDSKEFRAKHIMGARNLPSAQIDQSLSAIQKTKAILLYENSRPQTANRVASKLHKAGYRNIFILKEGLSKWGGKVKEN